MDANEATKMVFSRIQALDPQNASKIMGLLLLHDLPQRDMIRLALAPHSLLHSFILQAHTHLSLSSSSYNNSNNSISVPISSSSFSSSTLSNLQKLDQTHNNTDFLDETHLHNSDFFDPQPLEPAKMVGQHRRSLSFSDAFLGSSSSDPSLGWKPCLYYARGFCKNGSNCRFLHDSTDPTPIEHYQEQELHLLRSKSLQHQRLSANNASQLFAPGSPPFSAESLNFMLHQQQNDSQRGAARIEMNDFFMNPGVGMVNPASRQIYLTFPADSTFREEDVSNYFGIYGPVQDVRIPYQQKRMFGFVTFVFPDTVKLILSKGNPHFIADARVLVKPYKEKGKIPDKYKQQPQPEKGDLSLSNSTLNGLDSRDTHDLQFGSPRLLYGTQDLILRRKLEEETNLQRTIELQSQRLMNLQLLDVKKKHYYHHHHRNLSAGAVPFSSQGYSNAMVNQSLILPMSSLPNQSSLKENFRSPSFTTISKHQAEFNGNLEIPKISDSNFHDSVEHNLPDSLFASPTKSGGDPSSFSTAAAEDEQCIAASSSTCSSSTSSNNNNLMPTTSTLDMDSFESCFFQMPRFSTGHGAIEM